MGLRLRVILGLAALLLVSVTAYSIAVDPGWPKAQMERWSVIYTVAAVATAGIASAGLITMLYLREQVRGLRQQTRMQLAPYLRIDLAPDSTEGTWTPKPPDDGFSFDFGAFNPGSIEEDPFPNAHGDDEVDICLWVENRQAEPGGIATNVEIQMRFEVGAGDVPDVVEYKLELHYVEPRKRLRYRIGRVSKSARLTGEVTAIVYLDMYGKSRSFGYGSAAFVMNGSLENRRVVFQGGEEG